MVLRLRFADDDKHAKTVNETDGQLLPTLNELSEISDDPNVEFENSDAPEDDDDRAGAL